MTQHYPNPFRSSSDEVNTIQELTNYFQRNGLYLSCNHSPIHMMESSRDIPGLRFMSPHDFTDGNLPSLMVPSDRGENPPFLHLFLERSEVIRLINNNCPGAGVGFLFMTKETEDAAQRLGLPIMLPSNAIREAIGSKPEASRIATEAGVNAVPHILGRVTSYRHLRELAESGQLGGEVVVQTDQNDSGLGTFFITDEADYNKHSAEIESAKECRIMLKLRRPQSVTIECCICERGEIIGVPMLDHVGIPQLTPLRNAWCSNEAGAGTLPDDIRRDIRRAARKVCKVLRKKGYWGTVCLDFLVIETRSGQYLVYFQEINARFAGCTPLTDTIVRSAIGLPYLAFHFATFDGVHLNLDFDAINAQIEAESSNWSSLIIKHLDEQRLRVIDAPKSGVYGLESGAFVFRRHSTTIGTLKNDGFLWMREVRAGEDTGDVLTPAKIMGRVFLRGRVTAGGKLTKHALAVVEALRGQFLLRDYRNVA